MTFFKRYTTKSCLTSFRAKILLDYRFILTEINVVTELKNMGM